MKILKEIYHLFSGKKIRDAKELKLAKIKQNNLFSKNANKWIKDKELVVFFTSEKAILNGGIMSIFNLANYSRLFKKNVVIMSLGKKHTHIENNLFKNNETIYRLEQLFEVCEKLDHLILHIPECWVQKFNNLLTQEKLKKLKNIKDLHINILNQNIMLMPDVSEIEKLKDITDKITQTTAFSACATQKMANKYDIITHFLLTFTDFSQYKATSFHLKEKIIVLSPDKNEHKNEVVSLLTKNFPDYKLITVRNMTFSQYVELISKAFAVITFGEGFDGYFMEPPKVGTVSCAVYNDDFFPSQEWKNLSTVYENWDLLKANLCHDLKSYFEDCDLYYKKVLSHKDCEFIKTQKEIFLDNMKRFYQNKYDFFPQNQEQ